MSSLPQIEEELMKTTVSKYIDYQKQITMMKKKMKELKDAQTLLEKQLITTMRNNNLPEISLSHSGKIILKTKESKKSLPPQWFKGELSKTFENKSADDIRESLQNIISQIDNRPSTIKEAIVYRP